MEMDLNVVYNSPGLGLWAAQAVLAGEGSHVERAFAAEVTIACPTAIAGGGLFRVWAQRDLRTARQLALELLRTRLGDHHKMQPDELAARVQEEVVGVKRGTRTFEASERATRLLASRADPLAEVLELVVSWDTVLLARMAGMPPTLVLPQRVE